MMLNLPEEIWYKIHKINTHRAKREVTDEIKKIVGEDIHWYEGLLITTNGNYRISLSILMRIRRLKGTLGKVFYVSRFYTIMKRY